jgi:hypothetical protein
MLVDKLRHIAGAVQVQHTEALSNSNTQLCSQSLHCNFPCFGIRPVLTVSDFIAHQVVWHCHGGESWHRIVGKPFSPDFEPI